MFLYAFVMTLRALSRTRSPMDAHNHTHVLVVLSTCCRLVARLEAIAYRTRKCTRTMGTHGMKWWIPSAHMS